MFCQICSDDSTHVISTVARSGQVGYVTMQLMFQHKGYKTQAD